MQHIFKGNFVNDSWREYWLFFMYFCMWNINFFATTNKGWKGAETMGEKWEPPPMRKKRGRDLYCLNSHYSSVYLQGNVYYSSTHLSFEWHISNDICISFFSYPFHFAPFSAFHQPSAFLFDFFPVFSVFSIFLSYFW